MTSTPHDALFKAIFSMPAQAAAELSSVLAPRLSRAIDWGSLALVPGSFVDAGLEAAESDLLFEVQLQGRAVPLRIYLLFEHQSTADRTMPFRLLRYMVRIWEREAAASESSWLTPIVPVVLHHSEAGWTTATSFDEILRLDLFGGTDLEAHVPRFSFVLDDVSHQSDEEIASRSTDVLLRLALASLREARRAEDGAALIRRLARLIREVRAAAGLREAYGTILRYLLRVAADQNPQPFLDALTTAVGPAAKDEAMGLLDTMLEKGRAEGLATGLAEGKAEGLATGLAKGKAEARRGTLEKLLRLRFGALPETVHARVLVMDDRELDQALERILTATTLAEVVPH